jgi:hypothetical protein
MFVIKNKDGTTTKVEEQLLFTLFLKDLNDNKQDLLDEVEYLQKFFTNILDETALYNSSIAKIMNIFFLLGYQYARFKDKNNAELIVSDTDSLDTDPKSN